MEQCDHAAALHRVEPGERLVEHQHPWVVDQRCGDLDPLAHALGELADRLGADVVQIDLFERPVSDVGDVGGVDALRAGRDRHELVGREMVEECVLLWDETDRPADVTAAARVLAEDAQGAARRRRQAAQHAEQRRLAGTVRAQECGHALVDREAHLADGHHRSVELRHVVDRDHPRQRGGGMNGPPIACDGGDGGGGGDGTRSGGGGGGGCAATGDDGAEAVGGGGVSARAVAAARTGVSSLIAPPPVASTARRPRRSRRSSRRG